MLQPPPSFFTPPRRDLPGWAKGVLGMKACGAVAAIVLSAILLLAFNDPARLPIDMTPETAHRFASYAMLAAVASLGELLAVVGVWNRKRWGVYLLVGSSMIGFVFRMVGDDKIGAALSIGVTVLVGLAIASRWSDFD